MLFFPTVFADFRGAFLQEHESILCNTIVNGDIKIYCNIAKSTMCFFFFNLGTKQPIASIFFTATQLNTDMQISGLISIFIKCGMCQVFAQQVTIMVIKFHSISSQNQRNVNFICIAVQDELISSLCSLIGSKFQVTSSYVMWK